LIATARRALARAGLEIHRVPADDLPLYRSLYPASSVEQRRFYNVGAGAFFHPAWTNIDHASEWYGRVLGPILEHDLTSTVPLPVETSTAEIVYSSHTIEHVPDAAVGRLCREAFRVLKPGGILRITTGPDAETNFAALRRGDAEWFYADEGYTRPGTYEHIFHAPATSVPLEERWLHHFASALAPNDRTPSPVKFAAPEIREVINRLGFPACLDCFTQLCAHDARRPGNHISWWTHDKLIALIRAAGFETVYRSAHGQSRAAVLRNTRFFDNTHPQLSLYVEAAR
jgi:SAM-dependent methyltransferase